ncbi:MAG: hypothetical protein JWR19_1464 [Pedosphaera sp.]|nr:hypothetical protein [Pedosphaera sp.]
MINRPTGMFAGYSALPEIYDEMAAMPGALRPHWSKFVALLERLGREEVTLRWENARRIIREHGVTYNVYGDPQGMDRPWELDLVPLLIPPAEWAQIEAGLAQRARLFNLILADLYGPQRLVRQGDLPAALVYANPNFLRPCHGVPVPEDIYLHLHAADVARSSDGQKWVISDRTQAPSGAGYALENRIVLSRILPDEFRDCQVQRLASFFRIQRDTLLGLAPNNRHNPSVVLLTPGPYNETYFEHDYLARYLGFTLVEGGDLTVRDRKVFIKTLEGLRPVDVILRRVDDSFCDPLELRGDSFLGVAGLLEAVRAGNVTIANALGSGVIESPAFLAFLPGLCRRLLGEELKLPSVATWWCGQPKEREYVIEHLDEIVVKHAFGSRAHEPYFGAKMGEKERAKLVAAIRARPHEFVGQEKVALSTAPVWQNNKLEPRPLVLRTYVTATRDSFAVMPGGLTRVSTSVLDPIVSMQSGGGSKDTWVLSDGPVNAVSLLSASGQPIRSGRSSAELPSRVADNLFWLGRYTERLEDTLRLLRCVVVRMTDESGADGAPELNALAQVLVRLDLLPERFKERFSLKELEHEILLLIYKQDRVGSARQILGRVRGLASIVRDRFSADTWSILNKLNIDARSRPRRIPLADALGLLNAVIVDLSAFSGMEMENMTRGLGWRFLDFGRRLERATHLVKLFRASLCHEAKIGSVLEPVLEILDSLMTYRRRYFAGVQLPSVLELLLLDEGNPRSLAFQFKALKEHAANLPGEADTAGETDEERRIAALFALLRDADIGALTQMAGAGTNESLNSLLADFVVELGMLSNQLTHRYFTHTVASVS